MRSGGSHLEEREEGEKERRARDAREAQREGTRHDAHVLVCKGGDCKKRGSKNVRSTLRDELRAQGMKRDVRINSMECLGLCKNGPNLVVYPGGTWYLGVTEHDVPEIVRVHLVNGEPVEHLAAEFRPRKRAN